jgi:hypothetical protein
MDYIVNIVLQYKKAIKIMDKQLLLDKIKQAVQAIEPQAQIFLYGSRAR